MSMMGGSRRRPGKDSGPKAKFNQLVPYMKEQRGLLIIAVIFSLLGAGVNLAQPLVVGQIISAVQNNHDVLPLGIALLVITLLSAVTSGAMYLVLAKAGEGVVFSARKKLSTRLLRLRIQEYDLRRTGDLVSRVGSDTTLLRAALTQGLIDGAGGALIFVGSVIAMAFIDWLLLVLTLIMIAVAVAAIGLTSRRIRAATTKAQERVGNMSAAVERALSAVRTIRAARAETRESEQIEEDAKHAYSQGVKIAVINAWVTPIGGLAANGAFIVVLGVGGYRVATGQTEVANLITFILLMFLMIRPVGQFFGAYTSVQSALGALARIQEILDIPLEDTDVERSQPSKRKAVNSTAIEFRKVKFAYPARPETSESGEITSSEPKEILKGVSFKIERGTRVAIVGPSGAGKSTLLSLVERFYEPTAGEILLDGQPVRSLSRSDLRAQIGYVEQDAPVLAGSIRDNLLIGAPDANEKDLRRVLAEVNLTAVLKRDKRGLDAEVGEQGIMLSGGERQRLAIARTLLSAPPILLLDESTSSLDGLNEQRMREAIDAVAKNRTLIVIAHRLSTVVDSDQIIVLESGKVIGSGTHKQLLRSTPLYRELAATQMLD
ncbi:MAG: ABC transporter ATP-binding protein [Micrococcales bacterium]|nr:ABC transporter ATP-binding protein [Micrococcales bacterium]NBR54527.1 ABC transporter ATP-binding protein [Micrococcales bacterium]NBR61084.1 ABC transporter ATP-binding protein [Actinomycetota bacterium]NBT46550.1 ABC transporter ATP-binding protein [Actinomycetota bacterium]NBY43891.1 ABC transporter ATP-binding protein [Micrococcales bacterium]